MRNLFSPSRLFGDSLKLSHVELFKTDHAAVFLQVMSLDKKNREILCVMIALGQGHALVAYENPRKLKELASVLLEMEDFYSDLGGIVGYQAFIQKLIAKEEDSLVYDIEPPKMTDLRNSNEEIDSFVVEGIKRQKDVCEIIPCGGAADRLDHSLNGREYPAACFVFQHITLFERIMRDLEGREYLHKRCFGHDIETPIVIMTSHEKNNFAEIEAMCKKMNWFGRSPDSFYLIIQPSVPMIDTTGNWVCHENGDLIMRPGGHGVLWHLFEKKGIFDEFSQKGIKKGIVRQINNPAAGIDTGICALIGIGYLQDKKFGFTSCPRILGMNEGVNVVKLFKDKKSHVKRLLSNIEYCDFSALEKIDCGKTFPANTNTLFVDLPAIQRAQEKHPFPGLLLNFKKSCARLESTMQNIADSIQMDEKESTFLTFNDRSKALVAIKRQGGDENDEKETPGQAFKEMNQEAKKLLNSCGMNVSENSVFTYHPALGPLYSIIRQKIVGGKISGNSNINLEIAELYLRNLELDGELNIHTTFVTKDVAKCYLKNVSVSNKVRINLGRGSELFAEDLPLEGDLIIDVPDMTCLVLSQSENGLEYHFTALQSVRDALWDVEVVGNQVKLELKIQIPLTV